MEWMERRTVLSPPTVTGLNPTFGLEAGGTAVTITGTNFTGATAVDFGTKAASNLDVVNNTTITADSPAGTGIVNVTVTNPAGTSPVTPVDEFTYTAAAAPVVTGVSPTSGPAAGGTLATVIGTSFTGATAIDFGTVPATNLTVVNDTTITADSPAGTGTVDVTVTTPVGTSATSSADQFTYVAAPTVAGISPTSGSTAGGTAVTISGTALTGATAVDFGTVPATDVAVVNATTVTAVSPAGTGTVDVTVTTPGGTSATSSADHYTYTAPVAPTVTGLSPTSGSTAGGTLVTITGTNFISATAVDFGTTPATNVIVVNDTTITADSPAGTGTVDVTVTTPLGTSATSPADQYTYTPALAPAVTGVSPYTGSQSGGTLVTISGTSFTGATAVDFGTVPATNVSVVNDSMITADSPAGSGTVSVTVTTPAGTSPAWEAQFTYVTAAAPTVTAISPTSGPTTGGTVVAITGTSFTGATAVDFGTMPATNVTVVSDTSITADSPAGTGTVDVTVMTPGGDSATSPADQFTYVTVAAPRVTGLSPTFGTTDGGTLVTITGTSFTGATAAFFGNFPVPVTVVNDTTITTYSAPHTAGVVNVTVTTPAGTSAVSPADEFTYTAPVAPAVTAISPDAGPQAGGTPVTITGTSFTGAFEVDFGSTEATNVTVVNDTMITADSPAGTGTVDVTVRTLVGTSAKSPADQFTYAVTAAPTVTGLHPTSGLEAGGTLVTITGVNYTGATAVDFGTTPATNVTVVSDTSITADSPAGTGVVNVTVTTAVGTSAVSPADEFTYTPAYPPVVTGVSPSSGPAAGGTLVTITGTSFTGATAVDFGTKPATSVTVVNDTTITADSPAGTGTVDVNVTTPVGTSATSPADQFTYVVAPTVTGISPTSGSTAGGTAVTITGTALTGATAVDFGTVPATNVSVVNATTVTVVSPAGTGTVDVTVTTPGGTSATSSADQYTFTAAVAPTVTGISPTSGSTVGGTLVTITGTSFTGATAVDFGTTPATNVIVVNDSTLTADSPAGTGAVHVTVTTPAGTSATSSADQYTYTAAVAPTVTGLSPTSGSTAGGTLVTITGTGFTGATAVDFGTTPATNVKVVNDSAITADSPAGTGTVDVTVTTPAGTSATSSADRYTYTAAVAPTVTGISPTTGTQYGGTLVTISGTSFTGATAVDFGTNASMNVTVVNDSTITAESPPGNSGNLTVNVTVTTPAGTSAASAADQFTYLVAPAPTVTGLSPTSGPRTGDTLVTITGGPFTGATVVDFGTTPATNVTVVNDSTITAKSPAGTGTVDVTVTTPSGVSATSPADQFTYVVAAAPTVTLISPTSGPTNGGTLVTITGTSFTGATAVDFGTAPATNVSVVNDSTIKADSPAGSAGVVNVSVTTPAGTSAVSPADEFTYTVAVAPVVTAISPTTGSMAGGTLVTITGTSFTGATAVDFGTVPATNVTVVNDTMITANSPAATGTVDVTVTTPSGTSATSPADQFTYTTVAAPTVAGLNPTTGPTTGGTLVTITGTSFTGATAVDFGTVPATNVTLVNDTTITADSPAGTGVVNVTVTTSSGTSAISPDDQFTYIMAVSPTVVSLVRFGFHTQPTTLVLTFSSALSPTPAENASNYQLMTSSGTLIPITSAVYDASTFAVTLSPSQLLSLTAVYQLTVNGMPPNGLTSSTGVPIDGANNGMPGTNYVTMFSGNILAGAAPTLLRTAPKRFAAEMRELAALEKRLAAAPHSSTALRKRLEAAEKRMAAVDKKLAAQLARDSSRSTVGGTAVPSNPSGAQLARHSRSSTASAVDDLFGSGTVSVKEILASLRSAAGHPHA
jgi:hypothetical protein